MYIQGTLGIYLPFLHDICKLALQEGLALDLVKLAFLQNVEKGLANYVC